MLADEATKRCVSGGFHQWAMQQLGEMQKRASEYIAKDAAEKVKLGIKNYGDEKMTLYYNKEDDIWSTAIPPGFKEKISQRKRDKKGKFDPAIKWITLAQAHANADARDKVATSAAPAADA